MILTGAHMVTMSSYLLCIYSEKYVLLIDSTFIWILMLAVTTAALSYV